jgi:phage shock protein C
MRDYSRRGIYRSRQGVIFGVCRGLAQHFDFSVFWVRVIAVILLFFSGFVPAMIVYLLAAFMMKPEPAIRQASSAEGGFHDHDSSSRHDAAQHLRRRYEELDRRIRRMEDKVTSKEYDWQRRMGR